MHKTLFITDCKDYPKSISSVHRGGYVLFLLRYSGESLIVTDYLSSRLLHTGSFLAAGVYPGIRIAAEEGGCSGGLGLGACRCGGGIDAETSVAGQYAEML